MSGSKQNSETIPLHVNENEVADQPELATRTETPVSKKGSGDDRYQRYLPIVGFLASQESIDVSAVKVAFENEPPAFVTKLVNELAKQGWLVREAETKLFAWNAAKGDFSVEQWIDRKLFGDQITVSPTEERPRERLLALGAEQLQTSELIAILVRSGRPGESAVMAGKKLAQHFDGRLQQLPSAGRAQLKNISVAVEKTAYCQIMAGIELGRRVAALCDDPITTAIGSSGEAIAFCQRHFARLVTDAKQEEFHIVTLNTKNHVIDTHQITVGTLDASLVHPREVFRAAIRDAASSVILVHNHPSGDSTPSREDFAVTRRLEDAGKLIGIDVLDHIVVARQSSTSIREAQ